VDEDVGDDVLRLVFIACHPILSTEARVALTLRLGIADVPAVGLALIDAPASHPLLHSCQLLPSARGDLLSKLGRFDEARAELERARRSGGERSPPRAAARAGGPLPLALPFSAVPEV
jgi:predicted RNA polymerase sigma factor